MPTDTTRPLARRLLAAVLRHGPHDAAPDRDLLAKFAADRDEEAFAELVRRHGPMVLAVGRRVAGHTQDAEDAFQAAFLVLARRATHLVRPELLGNWLYGVAVRTALEARTARRRIKEQQAVAALPEPVAPEPRADDTELKRVIDEELARLPEKYRAAVVLCELEGVSRKDAAKRLRIPEGTLSSRLAYARKVLADRLGRRGVATTAGVLTAALMNDATATAVPAQLIEHTARAAARALAGEIVPPDLLPDRVATLTDGVMKAMIGNRLRLASGAAVLALGILGIGAAAVIGQNDPNSTRRPVVAFDEAASPPAVPAKAPAKVPAKGIEDDDVPYPSLPSQAVARFEDGRIIVRQRMRGVFLVKNGEAPTTVVRQVGSTVSAQNYDAGDASVFDVKGNRLAEKVWKEKLKTDQRVLVSFDGRLPHPRELVLFKDDTLVIVLATEAPPSGITAVPTTTYHLRTSPSGQTYYEPVTSYQYQTPPPPAPPAFAVPPSHPEN